MWISGGGVAWIGDGDLGRRFAVGHDTRVGGWRGTAEGLGGRHIGGGDGESEEADYVATRWTAVRVRVRVM